MVGHVVAAELGDVVDTESTQEVDTDTLPENFPGRDYILEQVASRSNQKINLSYCGENNVLGAEVGGTRYCGEPCNNGDRICMYQFNNGYDAVRCEK